ncbi:hypothetical protein ACO0LO_16695 [Undibacterium sp. TJN25]|uniref:hypothetical protein n=1 Tax=Undibacterium sp. TJN25 TaxID=3413056 RepID=UPI003BEFC148
MNKILVAVAGGMLKKIFRPCMDSSFFEQKKSPPDARGLKMNVCFISSQDETPMPDT